MGFITSSISCNLPKQLLGQGASLRPVLAPFGFTQAVSNDGSETDWERGRSGYYNAVADGPAGLTVVDLTSRESHSVSWKISLGSPANAIATAAAWPLCQLA